MNSIPGRDQIALALLLVTPLLACGKSGKYSPSCQSSAALTSPWDAMNLPVDEGRVCSSTSSRVEIQFIKGTLESWRSQFESRLLALGYAKDMCTENRCLFKRDKQRVNLMALETKSWKSIVLF